MTRYYRDGSRSRRSMDDERYGSEVPPGQRSRYSPRGNEQNWDDGMPPSRGAGPYGGSMRGQSRPEEFPGDIEDFGDTRGRPYGRSSYDRDPPENFAGDMEDFGQTRRAQFGHGDYYGSGEHAARKIGMHGRGRDQYFASDDDRDWDRGQIVRGRATQRPRDEGERSTPRRWRGSREEEW